VRQRARIALLTSATALLATVGVSVTQDTATASTPVFGRGVPVLQPFVAPAGSVHLSPLLVADPDFAGEPSVGVDWTTGAGMFMAGTNVLKLGLTGSNVTWSDVSPAAGLSQNLDPILTVEPTTGTTIAGGDTGACSGMFSSTDDGGLWLPSIPCTVTTDHPTVGWSPSATTPGGKVFYYCQQEVLDNCATSTDGLVWVPGANFNTDCLSLHGHLRGGPDGTAYLPNVDCLDPVTGNPFVGGLTTSDDGLTFTTYTIPGAPMPASGFDPAVAVDAANTLYEGWNNAGDYHPVVSWSKDHGATWAPKVDLATTVPGGIVASTFPTLVAGDAGRVAYTWLGTPVGAQGVDPFATGFHGIWYAYTSFTYDGGQTWTTVKDTPTPLQYGEIDAGGTTTSGQRNLLDFIDSSLTKDGRVLVALADGCLADCESAGSQAAAEALSTHAYATVAYQTAGKGLFAAYDVVVAPSAPTVTATSGTSVALGWTPPTDDGGAPVTAYKVYRRLGTGTPALLATTSSPSYTDASGAVGTTYTYTVTATNSAGESVPSAAVTASRYTVPGTPALSVSGSGADAQLSWTTPSNGGSPITGYRVLRSTTSGAETLLTTTTATSLVDGGLSTGTTYYYQVVALNAAGAGTPSAEATFSNAHVPGVTTLSAAPGVRAVTLTWTPPSDGGSAITGYVISRGTAPGAQSSYATVGAVSSYTDSAVAAGTTYYYRLQAVNAVGTGASSPEATATPYTTAAAPVLTGVAGKSQAQLSWTVPANGGTAITGYRIYRGPSAGTESLIQTISSGTSYIDPVAVGSTYSYRVAAVTAAGTGALSNSVVVAVKKK
jgi:fibronectin type 3 domain-containing protein